MKAFSGYLFKLTILVCSILMYLSFNTSFINAEEAYKVDINIEASSGQNCSNMLNDSYQSQCAFEDNSTITITADKEFTGLYIIWNSDVSPWQLEISGKTSVHGENGYLHEYISLDSATKNCKIILPSGGDICSITAYSKGDLPSDVQVWNNSLDNNADFLVFSTHADDEVLFLGAILTNYGFDCNVQVAYLCDFFLSESVREHEKLDGLWELGIKNYPVKGNFGDYGSRSLDVAMTQYDYPAVLEYTVECIRRFKPKVVVTQDVDGEYGHGGHMLFVKAVCEAIEVSNNFNEYPELSKKYGAWEPSKTYLHLYKDNAISLEINKPLAYLNGRTAIKALQDAYDKHVSQHQWDFKVTDSGFCSTGTALYDCSAFGLIKSTVGNDTGNDMLENIKTYRVMKAEAEALANAKEAEATSEDFTKDTPEEEDNESDDATVSKKSNKMTPKKMLINIIAILLLAIIVGFQFRRHSETYKKKIKENEAEFKRFNKRD